MTGQSTDVFHREVAAFIERHAPRGSYGRDFEHELRMLLAQAFEEAQRPFVFELNQFRGDAIKRSMLEVNQGGAR